MTRQRKVDPDILEREYIYDSTNPPISITQLAERHDLARSGVAEKARKGRWFERRKEFRDQLGIKATEALGEEWVRFETATREKMMTIGIAYLAKFEKALAEDEIKVSTRDALGIMAMLRALTGDAATARVNGEEVDLIDPDSVALDPDTARRTLAAIERLEAGPDEPDDPADAEAERAAGTGAD
jgi:hypothetical protein